jgi:hypothetical protein
VGGDGTVVVYTENEIYSIFSSTSDNFRMVAWHPNEDKALIIGQNTIFEYKNNSIYPVYYGNNHFINYYHFTDASWSPSGNEALIVGKLQDRNFTQENVSLLKYNGYDLIPISTDSNVKYEYDIFKSDSLKKIYWNPKEDSALITGNEGNLYKYHNESLNIIDNGSYVDNYIDLDWSIDGKTAILLGYKKHEYGDKDNYTLLLYQDTQLEIIYVTYKPLWELVFYPNGKDVLIIGGSFYYGEVNNFHIYRLINSNELVEICNNTEFWDFLGFAYGGTLLIPQEDIAFLIGGNYITTDIETTTIFWYDGNSIKKIITPNLWLIDISWNYQKKYALAISADNAIFTIKNGIADIVYPEIFQQLNDIDINPNNDFSLIVGDGGTILGFDGYKIQKFDTQLDDKFTEVCWSPNGNDALITGAIDGAVLRYHDGNLYTIWSPPDNKTAFFYYPLYWEDNSCAKTKFMMFNRSANISWINIDWNKTFSSIEWYEFVYLNGVVSINITDYQAFDSELVAMPSRDRYIPEFNQNKVHNNLGNYTVEINYSSVKILSEKDSSTIQAQNCSFKSAFTNPYNEHVYIIAFNSSDYDDYSIFKLSKNGDLELIFNKEIYLKYNPNDVGIEPLYTLHFSKSNIMIALGGVNNNPGDIFIFKEDKFIKTDFSVDFLNDCTIDHSERIILIGDAGKICVFDDSDFDGYNDSIEIIGGGNPNNASILPTDSDNDWIPDVIDIDDDNDGLIDINEDLNQNGLVELGETDPLNWDTDNDLINDRLDKHPLEPEFEDKEKLEDKEENEDYQFFSMNMLIFILVVLICIGIGIVVTYLKIKRINKNNK